MRRIEIPRSHQGHSRIVCDLKADRSGQRPITSGDHREHLGCFIGKARDKKSSLTVGMGFRFNPIKRNSGASHRFAGDGVLDYPLVVGRNPASVRALT